MATVGRDIRTVELTEEELWVDGPPYELFKRMRQECPIHWTEKFELFPEEAGFWSVTTADDIHTVSRDWKTYSSERGGVLAAAAGFPLELAQAMFIGMDPPKHDRLKALFQAGFTPKRIAAHEDSIRAIAVRVLDRLEGRETGDLVKRRRPADRLARDPQLHGHPRGGRRDLGATHELALGAADPDLNPDGFEGRWRKTCPRSSSAAAS